MSEKITVEFTVEELQVLDEISKKLAVKALAHRKERAYADFEAGNDPEKSSEWKKEKKTSSMVAKKHGSGAVKSAEKKSHKLLGYNPFDEDFNSIEKYANAISEQIRKERS